MNLTCFIMEDSPWNQNLSKTLAHNFTQHTHVVHGSCTHVAFFEKKLQITSKDVGRLVAM